MVRLLWLVCFTTLKAAEWHSFAKPEEVRVKHVDLDLRVLFDRQVLEGTATLSLERTRGREVVLDTRDLRILSVERQSDGRFERVRFTLGRRDPVRGTPLTIPLKPD